MKRRKFLKWLGITTLAGFLGIKIPWPNLASDVMPIDLMEKAFAKRLNDDIFKALQRPAEPTGRVFHGCGSHIFYGQGPIIFDSKNFIGVEYK